MVIWRNVENQQIPRRYVLVADRFLYLVLNVWDTCNQLKQHWHLRSTLLQHTRAVVYRRCIKGATHAFCWAAYTCISDSI